MLKALKDRISDEVPEGELRTAALERIKRLEAPPLWNLKKVVRSHRRFERGPWSAAEECRAVDRGGLLT